MVTTIIHLFGISNNNFPVAFKSDLNSCDSVFLSKRFEKLYQQHCSPSKSVDVFPITPLAKALDTIEQKLKAGNVAVFASGDPLFYGIGRNLINRFGQEKVRIHPSLSIMQIAFSRFRMNWEDSIFISLHGRKIDNLFSALMRGTKIFLFTDDHNSPNYVAEQIIHRLGHDKAMDYDVFVAENIGSDNEKLTKGSFEDIRHKKFSKLNALIIRKRRRSQRENIAFGLSENEIFHSRGLITKNEIRAVTLHQLRAENEGVFWDIGAGSGSISIELARLIPSLSVYSVEKKREHIENIKKNREKFDCWNVNIIQGIAPSVLNDLPDPDRIFIGGSGGNLEEILETATMRLKRHGRLIVNCVLDKTFELSTNYLSNNGFSVSISEVRVKRYHFPIDEELNLNPIRIVTAEKKY